MSNHPISKALLFAVLANWGSPFESTAAQFIEVSAEIQTTQWVDQGTNKPPTVKVGSRTMRCVVGADTWLIEGEFFPTHNAWWFTGSNLIAQTVLTAYPSERPELFKRNHPEMMLGRKYTQTFDPSNGSPVSHPGGPFGSIELEGTQFVNLPWLAFCSGAFLKREGRQIPLPRVDYWSYGLKYSDQAQIFKDSLGLPRVVDLCMTNGQPVCRYRVLESTNFMGWAIPLEFQVAQYRRDYQSGIWELSLTASGKVVALMEGQAPRLTLEAPDAAEQ